MQGRFIRPMLLLQKEKLPEGNNWSYQIKLDGYRSIAFKTGGKLHLRSRSDNDFNSRYPTIAGALASIPDETVIDGEVVALDADGRPSFNLLQNAASSVSALVFYVFDVLILSGQDVMKHTLMERRALVEKHIVPRLSEPVRYMPELDASLPDLVQLVKANGLEGLVAKRRDSRYESGKRSGAWMKMRVNKGQEFVIGGYTVGGNPFDALVFGYFEGSDLTYVARTRNGFTAGSRSALIQKFKGMEVPKCPFVNLPEARSGRWGQGLTKEKMAECRWLKPMLVGQFEFLEWTADNHLRHVKFAGLVEWRKAKDVVRLS